MENIDYIYGILVTDGNMRLETRNRGKIVLELNYADKDLVYKLNDIISNCKITERIRDTNFKKNYHSISLKNYRLEFRNLLIDMGFPRKNKTKNSCPPKTKYSKKDFWRGVIDGDGSIGFTLKNEPFISLITISEILASEFFNFIKSEFNVDKNINRNKRDNCYNIILKNEDAILLGKYLYENSTLYLDRKYNKFLETLKWQRTKKKIISKDWKQEEIDYILTHTMKESIIALKRSRSSISVKLWRLKK